MTELGILKAARKLPNWPAKVQQWVSEALTPSLYNTSKNSVDPALSYIHVDKYTRGLAILHHRTFLFRGMFVTLAKLLPAPFGLHRHPLLAGLFGKVLLKELLECGIDIICTQLVC